MKHLWMAGLLLTGCAQSPGAPPASVAQTPAVAPADRPSGHVSSASAASAASGAPQDGLWEFSYPLGQGAMRTQQLHLRFEDDHRVTVSDLDPLPSDYPCRWDTQRTSFEGLPRRDLLGGSAISRDRLDMAIVSRTEMRGTLSVRANLRWIPLPATARLVSRNAEVRVKPGTILDTSAPERIE